MIDWDFQHAVIIQKYFNISQYNYWHWHNKQKDKYKSK